MAKQRKENANLYLKQIEYHQGAQKAYPHICEPMTYSPISLSLLTGLKNSKFCANLRTDVTLFSVMHSSCQECLSDTEKSFMAASHAVGACFFQPDLTETEREKLSRREKTAPHKFTYVRWRQLCHTNTSRITRNEAERKKIFPSSLFSLFLPRVGRQRKGQCIEQPPRKQVMEASRRSPSVIQVSGTVHPVERIHSGRDG